MTDNEVLRKLAEIVFPGHDEVVAGVERGTFGFEHYTSAEAAISIIESKSIRLGLPTLMNDLAEVTHGLTIVVKAIRSEAGKRLVDAGLIAGSRTQDEAVARLESWNVRDRAWVFCMSGSDICDDPCRSDNGLLSMWRAYGGHTGVSLRINAEPLFSAPNNLGTFISRVQYEDVLDGVDRLVDVFDRVLELRDRPSDQISTIANFMSSVLLVNCLCAKHAGFAEENEWRIVALPGMFEDTITEPKVVTVRGVPRIARCIALRTYGDAHGNIDLSIRSLLSGVLVGPCAAQVEVAAAIKYALKSADADSVAVRLSDIPYRPMQGA